LICSIRAWRAAIFSLGVCFGFEGFSILRSSLQHSPPARFFLLRFFRFDDGLFLRESYEVPTIALPRVNSGQRCGPGGGLKILPSCFFAVSFSPFLARRGGPSPPPPPIGRAKK
jgi:hypothetical protein